MVWKLNEPFSLSVSSINASVSPVFDGRNMWVAAGTGITCIEYWGPFANELAYPNSQYTRWAEPEPDIITGANIGPKMRLVGSADTGAVNSMVYHEGFVFVSTATQIKKVNVTTLVVTVIGDIGVIKNSNLAILMDKIFFVETLPTTQTIDDKQKLYTMSISTGIVSDLGYLPSKKQTAPRDLVIANDILYITCMNTRQLHKYNAISGSYLTSIVVNRDIEKLYRVDNDVFVISSMKGKVTIEDVEYSTSMVSQVTQSDNVNHLYGILTAGKYMADAGDYVWFVNDSNLLQRTKKSNNSTFAADGTGPITKEENADYCIDNDASGWLNGVPTNVSISGIGNLFVTPSFTYQFFDGSSFVDVTVPRYLFLLGTSSVIAVRLPGALKWVNGTKLNQYTAVSTGGLGYKQG